MIYKPIVSIVLPVYNLENYLEESLLSICNQTYPLDRIELIAINDASTDQSLDILKQYEKSFVHMRIINQDNRGSGAVRNRGIDLASGTYIFFMDSDDWIDPNLISDCVELAEMHALQVCHFQRYEVYEWHGKKEPSDPILFQSKNQSYGIKSGMDFFKKQLKLKENCAAVWQYFFKTRFLRENKLRFQEHILHEDEPFTVRMLLLAERFINLEKAYYFRRIRPGSIMTPIKKHESARHYQSVLVEMHSYFPELNAKQAKLLSRYMIGLFNLVLASYDQKDVWERRQNLWSCAKMTRANYFMLAPDFIGGQLMYLYSIYREMRCFFARRRINRRPMMQKR